MSCRLVRSVTTGEKYTSCTVCKKKIYPPVAMGWTNFGQKFVQDALGPEKRRRISLRGGRWGGRGSPGVRMLRRARPVTTGCPGDDVRPMRSSFSSESNSRDSGRKCLPAGTLALLRVCVCVCSLGFFENADSSDDEEISV